LGFAKLFEIEEEETLLPAVANAEGFFLRAFTVPVCFDS
jgi:hypothetical protein